MNTDPSNPSVVKEFRFYPESNIVTVVFGDDNAEDFMGPENYHLAAAAAAAAHTPSATASDLRLKDQNGNSITVTVPKGAFRETFDA